MEPASVDLEDLSWSGGGQILVKRTLRLLAPGERVEVCGRSPNLLIEASAYARGAGHAVTDVVVGGEQHRFSLVRGDAGGRGSPVAERAGAVHATDALAVAEVAPARWGLAARGAWVEPGPPELRFPLHRKQELWSDDAGRLYAQAAAAQWDPAAAIDWRARPSLPGDVEDAVVQVMTYLIENETAALLVTARFLAQIHPHFREVMQLLSIQAADEARHAEVFVRRATLVRPVLGLSTRGGQESLATLLLEPDFSLASFLLSVLGEGSFLSLLAFLRDHAPDPTTREVARLTGQDEARHVAFGLSHLGRHVELDPTLRTRLANAVERRHAALAESAGLNQEVFDSLVLIAAGSFEPPALARGFALVQDLTRAMDDGRRQRLKRLGFSAGEAETLSSLHTKNFM